MDWEEFTLLYALLGKCHETFSGFLVHAGCGLLMGAMARIAQSKYNRSTAEIEKAGQAQLLVFRRGLRR